VRRIGGFNDGETNQSDRNDRWQGPRQRIWDAIRIAAKKQAFTQNDIERTAKVEGSAIKDYFKVLLKAGFITVSDTEQVKGICIRYSYQLARDNGIEAPRIDKSGNIIKEGTSNERMWQTMRRMFVGKEFNYRELAFTRRHHRVFAAKPMPKPMYWHCIKLAISNASRRPRQEMAQNQPGLYSLRKWTRDLVRR
jgi:hypothetical protein